MLRHSAVVHMHAASCRPLSCMCLHAVLVVVTDLALEYEEGETYAAYTDFYEDVFPEFRACGRIRMFKVCCNYEPHLRGNVYVQYER